MVRLVSILVFASLALFAGTAEDVSLVIRFADGSNRFRVGQVIPIELAFSTRTPDTYLLNTALDDPIGRIGMEQFEVAPKGRDPLYAYYHNPIQGAFVAGGLQGMSALGEAPQILQRKLNERVTLDKPGHYTLRVISSRVAARANVWTQQYLTSNMLEFDILEANDSWQRQTLSGARAVLDDPAAPREGRAAAEETLRYLDSPESVRELARQLTKPGGAPTWNFEAGLLGARDQGLVLKELEARVTAPDAALTYRYIRLLLFVQFSRAHALLPPYPESDESKQEGWLAEQRKLLDLLHQAEDDLYRRVVDSLAFKQGAAKASTIGAILVRPNGPHATNRLPDAEIAWAFPLLDEQQQGIILQSFPSRVAVPLMAGPLEAILDKPQLSDILPLRVNALQTLLQVNPKRGRIRVIDEIHAPHADALNGSWLLATCLSSLPDETLPELDEFLITRLASSDTHTMDLDARLIGRYSTEAILDRVKTIYRGNAVFWDLDATDGLTQYFLRVDPEYGLSIFMAKGSVWMAESLKEVLRLNRWPDVQPAFIQRLNNTDLRDAQAVAETLGKLGDSDAKKALLLRLRAFNKTWKPRSKELAGDARQPEPVRNASAFQLALIQALREAKNWSLSEEEKAEVESLTITGYPAERR